MGVDIDIVRYQLRELPKKTSRRAVRAELKAQTAVLVEKHSEELLRVRTLSGDRLDTSSLASAARTLGNR